MSIWCPFCSASAVSEGPARVGIYLWDCGLESEKPDSTPVSCSTQRREHRVSWVLPRSSASCMPSKVISSAPPVSPASSGLTLLFCPCCSEVELPLKKDGFTSESTTLEALLRGEGAEKKVDAREEESIQEIQVFLCPSGGGAPPEHCRRPSRPPAPAWGLLSRARVASQTALWCRCRKLANFFLI